MRTNKILSAVLVLLIIGNLFFGISYLKNLPSKYIQQHVDTAISQYKDILPYGYFETASAKIEVKKDTISKLIGILKQDKEFNKTIRITLNALKAISWVKDEEYSYETKDGLLLFHAKFIYLDVEKLLRESSKEGKLKNLLYPNPNTPDFETTVQNLLVIQYLINNDPPYQAGCMNLTYSLNKEKLVLNQLEFTIQ